eukprot:458159-Prymnesium_polylepis.1
MKVQLHVIHLNARYRIVCGLGDAHSRAGGRLAVTHSAESAHVLRPPLRWHTLGLTRAASPLRWSHPAASLGGPNPVRPAVRTASESRLSRGGTGSQGVRRNSRLAASDGWNGLAEARARSASARVGGVQYMCKRIFRARGMKKIVPQIRGVFLNYDPL